MKKMVIPILLAALFLVPTVAADAAFLQVNYVIKNAGAYYNADGGLYRYVAAIVSETVNGVSTDQIVLSVRFNGSGAWVLVYQQELTKDEFNWALSHASLSVTLDNSEWSSFIHYNEHLTIDYIGTTTMQINENFKIYDSFNGHDIFEHSVWGGSAKEGSATITFDEDAPIDAYALIVAESHMGKSWWIN